MEYDKINDTVREASDIAANALRGDKLRQLINNHVDENGKVGSNEAMLIAIDFSKQYSERLLIETLSRLL